MGPRPEAKERELRIAHWAAGSPRQEPPRWPGAAEWLAAATAAKEEAAAAAAAAAAAEAKLETDRAALNRMD